MAVLPEITGSSTRHHHPGVGAEGICLHCIRRQNDRASGMWIIVFHALIALSSVSLLLIGWVVRG